MLNSTPIRIAIIEDDAPIASMYEFKFTQSGYLVRCARDGAEGLKLIKEIKPDLVLLDLKMPVMSGDEMLEKLRNEEWGKSIRVIVLTNISRAEAPSKLRFLNVDRYIVKAHHTPQQVLDIAREVLK
ncbi:response regulator [soil metagenome]